MTRSSPSLLALAGSLALVAFAAGCGGTVETGNSATGGSGGAGGSTTTTTDIAGVYEVTHLTRNSASCIGEGDPVQGTFYYSHFRMQAESDGSYSFADCDSADPSSCSGSFRGLPWRNIAYAPAGDGSYGAHRATALQTDPPGCALEYVEAFAAPGAGADLRIDVRIYAQMGSLDNCTTAEAESLAKQMPCVAFDVVAGNKLP